MKQLYWRARIFFLSLRWILQINLGDMVIYRGKKYTVCNGVRPGSWRLGDLDNNSDGWVPRKDCKKVWNVANIRHSFFSGWNFYMKNWFGIWCHGGIKSWMRSCNIWPWPFKD